MLIVSDLHFEKSAAFARRGMMLPPYDTAETLNRLEDAILRYQPESVICLGDSFHDQAGVTMLVEENQRHLNTLINARRWIWISGNHDPKTHHLGGEWYDTFLYDDLLFRHEPTMATKGEISGHYHPALRIKAHGGSVRRSCFACDGNRLILPAFGCLAGGLDLRHHAFNPLFDHNTLIAYLIGENALYPIKFERNSFGF